ncbi:MAG: hypothetical protein RMJ36_07030, partial [Candidatus Calescibacterium sp.]|nr:hypothetical protein [Candidatus Calescibacterium sp.]MDW8133389.1 hypothetical protein [Candidatus Calescibacterium sp.]
VMSMYMIVYWGSDVKVANDKIMIVNNVMTFIQQDMINNSPLYFEVDNQGRMRQRTGIDINEIIRNRLRSFYYLRERDYVIRDVKFIGLDLVDKPNEVGLTGGNFDNIYRVRIEVEWIHKGRINKYRTDFLISSYNFKKITVNQRLNENDLKVNLPNSCFDVYRVVLQFPGTVQEQTQEQVQEQTQEEAVVVVSNPIYLY